MLARKGGKGRRFSIGPALVGGGGGGGGLHRRLSVLNNHRLALLATREEDEEGDALQLPPHCSLSALLRQGRAMDDLPLFALASPASVASQSSLAVLLEGRLFTGYTADSRGRYHRSTLLLFYTATPPTLHWCPYGMKQIHANASLPLSSLTSVLLGKVTPALLSPLAREAREERCLSLQGTERSIDLEGRNERRVIALLLSVLTALQQEGRTLRCEREGGEVECRRLIVAVKETAVVSPLLLPLSQPLPPPPPRTPLPHRPASPSSPPPPSVPAPAPPLVSLHTGRPFVWVRLDTAPMNSSSHSPSPSSPSPSLIRQPIVLSFSGDALHWKASTGPSAPSSLSQTLPLRSIRDIYFGHSTATMRAAGEQRGVAPVEKCVSLTGRRGAELNLLASSQAEVKSLVAELMALLQGCGKEVKEDVHSSGAPPPSQPTSATSTTASPPSPPPPPPVPSRPPLKGGLSRGANKENQGGREVASASPVAPSLKGVPSGRRLSVVSATPSPDRLSARSTPSAQQPLVQRMAEGRRFVFHHYPPPPAGGGASTPTSRPVLLSYTSGAHALSLYPAPSVSGRGAVSPSTAPQSLPLRQLTEVVTGKQTALFLDPACAHVARERCLCLIAGNRGKGGGGPLSLQWHLEAETGAALSSWLTDLQALLASQGKQVVVEAGKASTPGGGVGAVATESTSRRFSIVSANSHRSPGGGGGRPAAPQRAGKGVVGSAMASKPPISPQSRWMTH